MLREPGEQVPTVEVTAFDDLLPALREAGTAVYGVPTDDAERHRAFADEQDIDVTLLVDPDGKVADAFGVPVEEGATRRTTFVCCRRQVCGLYEGVTPPATPRPSSTTWSTWDSSANPRVADLPVASRLPVCEYRSLCNDRQTRELTAVACTTWSGYGKPKRFVRSRRIVTTSLRLHPGVPTTMPITIQSGNTMASDIVHRELETDVDNPATRVAEAVAEIDDRDITDLTAMYGCVDGVLDNLFSNPPASEAQMEVKFTYETYRITVEQDGAAKFVKSE